MQKLYRPRRRIEEKLRLSMIAFPLFLCFWTWKNKIGSSAVTQKTTDMSHGEVHRHLDNLPVITVICALLHMRNLLNVEAMAVLSSLTFSLGLYS